jgi:cytochrome c5
MAEIPKEVASKTDQTRDVNAAQLEVLAARGLAADARKAGAGADVVSVSDAHAREVIAGASSATQIHEHDDWARRFASKLAKLPPELQGTLIAAYNDEPHVRYTATKLAEYVKDQSVG